MPDQSVIVRGNTITKDAFYVHADQTPATPVDPKVSIIDALGVTVVLLDTPSFPDTPDHGVYEYPVDGAAPLGAWQIVWYGTIDGFATERTDWFTVVGEPAIIVPGGSAAGDVCGAWCSEDDLDCDTTGIDPLVVQQWIVFASNTLNRLIGGSWPGSCEDSIRPCASYSMGRRWGGSWSSMSGWCGCYDATQCGCKRLSQLHLPGYPATSITEVVIDGEQVDPARYRIDDRKWLVWIPDPTGDDPRTGWPCCQDLTLDDDAVGTFSVTYRWGLGPPTDGRMMAAKYACQLILGSVGSAECSLPEGVISAAQQGLTFSLDNPTQFISEGRVGVLEVDTWVMSVLKGRERRSAIVHISSPPSKQHSVRRPGA